MSEVKTTLMQPGERIAFFEIVAYQSGEIYDTIRYQVKTTCCGMEKVMRHKVLRDYARCERVRCDRCDNKLSPIPEDSLKPGDRMGTVTLLARAEAPHTWRVRWDCCGREVELITRRLRDLRYKVSRGFEPKCPICARLAAQGRYQAAITKPPEPLPAMDLNLDLVSHLWTRPIPAGLARNLWGHPWAP